MTRFCIPLFLILTALVSAQMPPISGPTHYVQQPFDIEHYELNAFIDSLPTARISAECTIQLRWTQSTAQPSIPLHLHELTIDSVLVNGKRIDYVQHGEPVLDTFHYRVPLEHDVVTDITTSLTVYYHGQMQNEHGAMPWGGVHYADSVLYTLGVGFNSPYVSNTAYWMPCYDHPSDKATFRGTFRIRQPTGAAPWEGGLCVVSVGKLVHEENFGDTLSEFVWEQNEPCATYLLTFAAGPFKRLVLTKRGTPDIEVYSLARDLAASEQSYKLLPEMTTLFSNTFGAYPMAKVGYVNTQKGAMEHQSLVSFPVSLVKLRDTINTTAAHELAHQWWGDLVTPLDFTHVWLTEAFATFCESLWIEHLLGPDIYLTTHAEGATRYRTRVARQEGTLPLYNFPRTPPSSNYPETIYRKGAIVLAMARTLAGDKAFFAALQRYLDDHRFGVATTTNMIEALTPALGSMVQPFFDEWVFGIGWPKLSVEFVSTAGNWKAIIRQTQKCTNPTWPIFTTLPLNLVYRSPGSGNLADTVIIMQSDSLVLPVFSPDQFSINNGTKCRSLVEVSSTTTSLTTQSAAERIHVYPNPADNIVSVRLENIQARYINIFDVDGVLCMQLPVPDGTSYHVFNLQTLVPGMFTMQTVSETGVTFTTPLIISR